MADDLEGLMTAHVASVEKLNAALKAMAAMKPPAKKTALPDDVLKDLLVLEKQIAKLRQTVEAAQTVSAKLPVLAQKAYKSILAEVDAGLAKAIKSYQAAVKKSDGLTALRPATVKALDAAARTRDRKAVDAAGAALDAHLAEVKKDKARDKDPKIAKALKQFEADLKQVKAELDQL